VAESVDSAYAVQRQLLLSIVLGTAATSLLVGLLAAYLSNRGIRPLLTANATVRKIAQGDLNTRVTVESTDELGQLGTSINQMSNQIKTLLDEQAEARQDAERNAQEQRQQKEELQLQLLTLLSKWKARPSATSRSGPTLRRGRWARSPTSLTPLSKTCGTS